MYPCKSALSLRSSKTLFFSSTQDRVNTAIYNTKQANTNIVLRMFSVHIYYFIVVLNSMPIFLLCILHIQNIIGEMLLVLYPPSSSTRVRNK